VTFKPYRGIKPRPPNAQGHKLLALEVIASAVRDYRRGYPVAGDVSAWEFLFGTNFEGEPTGEDDLSFWCQVAGIDPSLVIQELPPRVRRPRPLIPDDPPPPAQPKKKGPKVGSKNRPRWSLQRVKL